jgi:hypothetical protein
MIFTGRNSNYLEKSLEKAISRFDADESFTGDVKVSVYDINSGVSASVGGDSKGWCWWRFKRLLCFNY